MYIPRQRLAAIMLAGLLFCWSQLAFGWQTEGPPAPIAPADPAYWNGGAFDPAYGGYEFAPDGTLPTEPFMGPPDRPWWQPQSFTGQMMWLGRSRSSDEALLLTRGDQDPGTLIITHTPAVFLSDLNFPAEIGARASVLFGTFGSFQTELSYLGMFDQQGAVRFSEAIAETGVVFFDGILIPMAPDITQTYESDLHTAEWNVWCDDGWRVQGLIGARWFQQSEQLEQLETFDEDDRALTQIRNDLIGAQVGFRTYLFERGYLSVLAIGKGGVYRNSVRLAADLQNGGAQLAAIEQTDDTTSYAGELDISAVWQITPYFNFHVGYTGLWLTNVALIGDQLNEFTTAGTGSFDYEGIAYQGGHLGLTLAW
jgi:hypothetical protein